MFAYLHYNGAEPGWASALRQYGVACYSPALTLESQMRELAPAVSDGEKGRDAVLSPLRAALEQQSACIVAREHSKAFQLDDSIFTDLKEAEATLISADSLADTSRMVWRDQWLLARAALLVAENGSSSELPLLARLWRIPVVGISFTPVGSSHWFSHCAQITVNSPENVEQILGAMDGVLDPLRFSEGTETATEDDCREDCTKHETCRE